MQKTLLAWYDQNKRTFPWRSHEAPHPYHVWLSEIMLQQTTTTTVIPYFLRFIKQYPTLADLKKASLDDVYLLWQGLGYYSRARNLHKAALLIEDESRFPSTKEALLALPGIGEYTASAVAAIAFNEPVLPIDGNIRRVMARFYGLEYPCGPVLNQKIIDQVGAIQGRPGDFCQALMDLARKICLPKNPLCSECPLSSMCAKKTHLPLKQEKPLKKVLYSQAFIIRKNGQILLSQNQDLPLLKGLWNVPMASFSEAPYAQELGYKGTIRHIFTHIDLRVDIYTSHDEKEGVWIEDISSVPLSKLAMKIINI